METPHEPTPEVAVGPNVHVSKLRERNEHAEVVLAADPKDAMRLLAASMVVPKEQDADRSVVVYRSVDGGNTWELILEKKPTNGKASVGDPAIAYGPDGFAYFAALGPKEDCFELVSSCDGGKTWERPTTVDHQGMDRPFLAVDGRSEKFRGRLHCFCRLHESSKGYLAVYTSRDGGKTLDSPKLLEVKNASGGTPGQGAVLSDGTLVLPYSLLYRLAATSDAPKHIPFAIRVRRSTNGGESFLEEQSLHVADFLGGRYPIMPMLAADPGSTAFKNYLYLVWSEMTPDGKRVMFSLSKDKGANWAKPIILSEPAKPKEGEMCKDCDAELPSVAVNREGIIAVLWYELFRDAQEREITCTVRFRASLDGGATWLQSVAVTNVASRFDFSDTKSNWLGDTSGLTADAAGGFHLLWIDNRTGIRQAFTTKVTVKKNGR